jgi:peptidyl-prolyl cis-trans isomerase SurA
MKIKKILFPLLLLCMIISHANAAFLLDRIVAIVNDEVITWSELYRSMEMDATPAVKAMSEEERLRIFKENEAQFMETMINYRLQSQEAKNTGIKVSEDEIKDAIDGIKRKYGMTEEQFRQSLKAEGYAYEEYRKRLQEQIIISKVVNQQIRNKILLTDRDVDEFIKENREFSSGAESYKLRQIFFRKKKDGVENSRLEDRAKDVHDRILRGEQFSDLAKQYSDDPSGSNGGDLGLIDKRSLAREFSDALSAMKTGDVSSPFWTAGGLHIIKLEEKSALKSPAELREDAKQALGARIFNEKYSAWVKSLRERAFIDIRL